jgi:Cys-rich protein (TIGR01571 family)
MAHSYHQYTPGVGVQVQSNVSEYPSDRKPDLGGLGLYPVESEQFANSILPEDARYLRKQATENPPQSSASSPAKSKRELQTQAEAINIVPDENPLSPTFFNRSVNNQKVAATSESAVDKHLPGQALHANQYMKGGTWKHGLCDCGDIGVCCTGIWCPCILYGRTQYRLTERSERRDPTNLLGFSAFNGSCAAFAVLCGCNFVLAAIQHSRVRKAYGIPGGVGTDLLRACCCCCCTLSQDEKEIKYRETEARRSSGLTMQYASPDGMSFSPPPT